jgi:hypothetical protein
MNHHGLFCGAESPDMELVSVNNSVDVLELSLELIYLKILSAYH